MNKTLLFYSQIDAKNLEQKLKQKILESFLKIPFLEMIELPKDYDHCFVKKYLETNASYECYFFFDYKNINSLSLLAGLSTTPPEVKIHLFVDDLFYETSLRLDSMPLNSLSEYSGELYFPSSAHAKFVSSFFSPITPTVLPWLSLTNESLYSGDERQKTREKLNVSSNEFCILIPLANQRDSNILFVLDALKEMLPTLNKEIHFLLCMNDENPNITSLQLRLPPGLLYQEIQEKMASFPEGQTRVSFLDKLNESHFWAADLYLDLSTNFPSPLRLEVSLAQDCGLSALISSWGCCQKNIYQNSFSPLTVLNVSMNREGLHLAREELIYGLKQLINFPSSFEQRLLTAQKSRAEKRVSKLETLLQMNIYNKKDHFPSPNWKLRHFHRSLQTPTERFTSQEFLGHLYDNFQSPVTT